MEHKGTMEKTMKKTSLGKNKLGILPYIIHKNRFQNVYRINLYKR